MHIFEAFVTGLNNIIWSKALVYLCLAAGIYLSVRMKFPQFRLFKEMCRLIVAKPDTDKGITPFQSFAATVGSRVGMGNIAGVATAIFFGGPGAVFWMWCIALIGAASAFSETCLAQAYKRLGPDGVYVGGPAHFIERGVKFKPLAIAFAIMAVFGPGIMMPGVQVQSLASTFENSFGVSPYIIGALTVVLIAVVVFGGVKRISKVAELLAPFMCITYLIFALIITFAHIKDIPHVFGMIFSSAFGANAIYGSIVGTAVQWGVKRGVYSNEAGQGSGPIIAASAECSHPAKQGLVQAGSVYIDTLLVCTCTAMIILLTGHFNVSNPDGTMITENIPGVAYGVLWAQNAIIDFYGGWAGKALALIVIIFIFTSLMGYYYQAEANVRYLSKENKTATLIFRIIFLCSVFAGVLIKNEIVWSMGDIGCGGMAWFNLIGMLIISGQAIKILKDYEAQRKAGKEPVFHPQDFGIEDIDGVWDDYQRREKEGLI